MKQAVFLFSSTIMMVVTADNYRRQLIPKTLAQKLCEKDSSLTICSLAEVTKSRNPVTVWGICEDHPQLLLCRFKPPAQFPVLQTYKLASEESETSDLKVNQVPELRSIENPRRALMNRVMDDIIAEKKRREGDDDFGDSIMLAGDTVFDDIRLI